MEKHGPPPEAPPRVSTDTPNSICGRPMLFLNAHAWWGRFAATKKSLRHEEEEMAA
ncbi:hypothetical protein FACS1894137_19740 [Spirochaetia bacterium]|nr:hypothetical protein FACS1894137_19740 [Spirochaetia bacterium]